jgi:hypothetical protein
MSEFEILIDKVAKRLAKNYRPHRATLNKLYTYPIDKVLKLDIQNTIADYENGRITDHELIDFLREITAE